MADSDKWTQDWAQFIDEYAGCLGRFHDELDSAWKGLSNGLRDVGNASSATAPGNPELGKLGSVDACFGETAEPLLVQPVRRRLREKQQQKALGAIHSLNQATAEMARGLPSAISVSERVLARTVSKSSVGFFQRGEMWLHWRRTPLRLREVVTSRLHRERLERVRLDGEFQVLLAEASLALLGPWSIVRRQGLNRLSSADGEAVSIVKARERWQRGVNRLSYRATKLLERYKSWHASARFRMEEALLSRYHGDPSENDTARLRESFRYWWRQQKAVQGVLELELELAKAARHMVDAAEQSLGELDSEHDRLKQELVTVTQWLDDHRDVESTQDFPVIRGRLGTAETRVDACVRKMSALRDVELPTTLEAVEPKQPLPSWRKPWRKVEPDAVFRRAIRGTGRRVALGGFQEAEAAHSAITADIERAREVVSYAVEVVREEKEDGSRVASEAVTNAITLLRSRAQSTPDVRLVAEAALTRGMSAALLECYIALDQGRIGLLAHLFQEAGERGARRVWQLGVESCQKGSIETWRHLKRFWNLAFFSLGLKTPPAKPAPAVVRSERLEDLPEFQLRSFKLPLIYERLFRLAPLEESRFLVGRDEEIEGLAEAKRLWVDGKVASALVVGVPGSGKSSLLNCAEQEIFAGSEVVRTSLSERIVTAEAIEEFLRNMLGLSPSADLAENLNAERRVIILEEVERTFLRRMHGYEALRCLLELVAHTWHSTLWVFSMNEAAYRFLDRVTRISHYFSHRINAVAVKREELEEAILLRHRFSGYRDSFEPPAEGDPRVNQLRRRLGIEADPQSLFFDSLYEQSQGIYHTALDLWRRHIEKIEGGIVHLRQPATGSFMKVISSLSSDNLFTLQAIVQHGSLRVEDLAEVFSETLKQSQGRVEGLLAVDVLEEDPITPGFRVQPAAGRLVREALHRQNL